MNTQLEKLGARTGVSGTIPLKESGTEQTKGNGHLVVCHQLALMNRVIRIC